MKKKYVKPQMEIVEMEIRQPLLFVGSLSDDGVNGGIRVGRKRHNSLWDDDEIE